MEGDSQTGENREPSESTLTNAHSELNYTVGNYDAEELAGDNHFDVEPET